MDFDYICGALIIHFISYQQPVWNILFNLLLCAHKCQWDTFSSEIYHLCFVLRYNLCFALRYYLARFGCGIQQVFHWLARDGSKGILLCSAYGHLAEKSLFALLTLLAKRSLPGIWYKPWRVWRVVCKLRAVLKERLMTWGASSGQTVWENPDPFQ